jgi:4-diphosphocytidyl-2-C-methyl-D-erythritol kinase
LSKRVRPFIVAGMRATLTAPAKINLHLEVLDRRIDGFHGLVSLFQAVDLADTLWLERTGTEGPVSVSGMPGLAPEANLVVQAVEIFRRRAGVREGVRAGIDKRIPIGAGFGGGSSDAAAALRCCQALFGAPLGDSEIIDCARTLGSDVPFFLVGPAAIVEGRGEKVRRIVPRIDFSVVAATPEARVRTVDAFAWLDDDRGLARARRRRTVGPRAIGRAYRNLAPDTWPFVNSFDGPVMGRHDEIAALRERMRAAGAANARLTGSGSTMIAVFADPASAGSFRRALAADPPPGTAPEGIRLLAPLASLPGVEYYG